METVLSIGENVKKLREKFGINQTQLADYLSVDQSYISKCESGERQYTVDMLEKICDLFGCDYEDVEDGKDVEPQVQFAFRANNIAKQDLQAIASVNRIVTNIRDMKKLLGKYEIKA